MEAQYLEYPVVVTKEEVPALFDDKIVRLAGMYEISKVVLSTTQMSVIVYINNYRCVYGLAHITLTHLLDGAILRRRKLDAKRV